MSTNDPNQARRIDLILQQIDALPTLSAVAVRLLDLTTSATTHAEEVIQVVSCDPALAAKVIKLCRSDALGRSLHVTTIDRAVKLLGFEAVRCAALAVQVFEVLDGVTSAGGEKRGDRKIFDRQLFWQHSLAVAICAEQLARTGSERLRGVGPSDAFLAGLLHDLGQLSLHVILPSSFDAICDLSESQNVSLDQPCRKMIGIDTHTAGKHLAEHWRLPQSLVDVVWLSGQPYKSVPDLAHKPLIGLITLADAIARRQHITAVGNAPRGENIADLCAELGIDEQVVLKLIPSLSDQVHERAAAMGIDLGEAPQLLLQSVSRANEVLGRIIATLNQRTNLAARYAASLKSISRFHDSIGPGLSVIAVLGKVVASAAETFGQGTFCILYQATANDPWQLLEFATDGRLVGTQVMIQSSGPGGPVSGNRALGDEAQISLQAVHLLPMVKDHLPGAMDPAKVRLLPLRCGWGISSVLVHDGELEGKVDREQFEALARTWGAAVGAAAQHAGAKQLGEQLAQANRMLTETQDELARTQTLAALGEVAAGAAHEMNNPLTVISGRSQLLATNLQDMELKSMAQQIVEQSHKLSDLISALRLFSEPIEPQRREIEIRSLIEPLIKQVRPKTDVRVQFGLNIQDSVSTIRVDPDQVRAALLELLRNAVEARPESEIEVRVQTDPSNDRLMIQVADDGQGMTEHVLAHAFDPFFSAKPAGRQPGLGLARARQLIEGHGGQLTLRNGTSGGALATIWLGDWRPTVAAGPARRSAA